MDYLRRCQNISEKLSAKNIDCIAVATLPNLRYFFNYCGQFYERFCCGLISKDGAHTALVVPKLDIEKAEKSSAGKIFPWDDSEGYQAALKQATDSIRSKGERIGCESGFSLGMMDQIKEVLGTFNFTPIDDEISNLRLVKDQSEVSSIMDSARKLSRGYKAIPDIIEAGKTEAEVAFQIMSVLSKKGLKTLHFPLVQSGSNSAIPHSEAGARKIRKGDVIVIDISGTNDEGYFSDFTRTYVIGKPSAKQTEVYEAVKEAQADGAKASVLGNPAEAVDRAARSAIEKAGYGEFFIHRTGHGLGLEVHEAPYLKKGNNVKLENGMAFTVEPGVYLSGKFGVRIEDNIVISKDRSENITALSHELVEI
jgi:Xaa-Pro dipeptidase